MKTMLLMAAARFLRDGIVRWIDENYKMVPPHDAARAANRAAQATMSIQRGKTSYMHVGSMCSSGKILSSGQPVPRRNDYVTNELIVISMACDEYSMYAGVLFCTTRIYLAAPATFTNTGLRRDDRKMAQQQMRACRKLRLL